MTTKVNIKKNERFFKTAICVFGALVLGGIFSTGILGESAILDSKNLEEINMLRGDLEAIKTYSLGRVSISNPEIADIANVDSEQILLLAKKAGQTVLFIWDQYGKRTIIVRVFEEDLVLVQERIQQLFKKAEIENVILEVNNLEGKVVISGKIPTEKKADLEAVIQPFAASVMNMVKEEPNEDLVQVDVQIAGLNSSISKSLGIDWSSAVTYSEDTGNFTPTPARDTFKVGPLGRTTAILAKVNALITEGKGRVLSKPKIVVISGKEASFLVGGEIPIRTTTTSAGGNVQEEVEFKDYGVSLTITPAIRGNKVDVTLSIEVSDIDSSQPVPNDVAFITRTAQTQLLLENGQTMVLAGLIKHQEGETIRKIPFFGDIPIIGFAFRSRTTPAPEGETELVISLTPTIIQQRNKLMEQQAQAKSSSGLLDLSGTEPQASAPKEDKGLLEGNISVPAEMAPYVQMVQKKISQAIAYPLEAQEKGWEGTVKLLLHILKDGSLKSVTLKESSGHEVFDNDALNTAQILAPFDPFPSSLDLEELILTIPIIYSKNAGVQDGAYASPQPYMMEARFTVPEGATYSQMVQQRIAEAIVYPEEARENGWEGTVKLGLNILRDGTLAYASVKQSSGYELFDQCALETAKNLAPYSVFPAESDLQELTLTVPIIYSLKNNSNNN